MRLFEFVRLVHHHLVIIIITQPNHVMRARLVRTIAANLLGILKWQAGQM
jgi:hypothetical protein